jgi:hypothetical protein
LGKLLDGDTRVVTLGENRVWSALSTRDVYMAVSADRYDAFVGEASAAKGIAAYTRGADLEWDAYADAIFTKRPVVTKVVVTENSREGAKKGVCFQLGTRVVLIQKSGVDSDADVTMVTAETCRGLGAGVRPSATRINQSGGDSSGVLGCPDSEISVVLAKGTEGELRLPLKRVYVVETIGAGVDAILGTEVLLKAGTILSYIPPAPKWMFHPRFASHRDLSFSWELPLTVLDRDTPLVTGMLAATEQATAMMASERGAGDSDGGSEASLQGSGVSRGRPRGSGDPPPLGGVGARVDPQGRVLSGTFVLFQVYHQGNLYPQHLTSSHQPPTWEELLPALCQFLEDLRARGEPLEPPPEWAPAALPLSGELPYVQWLGGGPQLHQQQSRPDCRSPWSVAPEEVINGRWQLACQAVSQPEGGGAYCGMLYLTREQYNQQRAAGGARIWEFIAQQLYMEAFRRYRSSQGQDMADNWCPPPREPGGRDLMREAYLSQAVPASVEGVTAWIQERITREQLVGPPALGRVSAHMHVPGIPNPNFSAPLEEEWCRLHWESEGRPDELLQERREDCWLWTAAYTAIYGCPDPSEEVQQGEWDGWGAQERCEYLNRKLHNMVYHQWASRIEGTQVEHAQVGALPGYTGWVWHLPLDRPVPTQEWAEGYLGGQGAGVGPGGRYALMQPICNQWVDRDGSRALHANAGEEWQLDTVRVFKAAGSRAGPMTLGTVEVTVGLQEARRWTWAADPECSNEVLYEGAWDLCTAKQMRSAYLKQLYRVKYQQLNPRRNQPTRWPTVETPPLIALSPLYNPVSAASSSQPARSGLLTPQAAAWQLPETLSTPQSVGGTPSSAVAPRSLANTLEQAGQGSTPSPAMSSPLPSVGPAELVQVAALLERLRGMGLVITQQPAP